MLIRGNRASSPEVSVSISNRVNSRFVVKEGVLRKGFLYMNARACVSECVLRVVRENSILTETAIDSRKILGTQLLKVDTKWLFKFHKLLKIDWQDSDNLSLKVWAISILSFPSYKKVYAMMEKFKSKTAQKSKIYHKLKFQIWSNVGMIKHIDGIFISKFEQNPYGNFRVTIKCMQ